MGTCAWCGFSDVRLLLAGGSEWPVDAVDCVKKGKGVSSGRS